MARDDQTTLPLKQLSSAWFALLDDLPLRDLDQLSAELEHPSGEALAPLRELCASLPMSATDKAARADLIDSFTARALRYFRRHNQFLQVSDEQQRLLNALHEHLLDELAAPTADIRGVFNTYRQALAELVRGLAATNGSTEFVYSEPVCSEYTPVLQLQMLGVAVADLREPILDLGCGEQAALVRFLREQGLETVGIDIEVEPGPFLHRADWFSFELGEHRWGTILSHQGFSLHFLHHHLRRNGHPERYARRFMEILRTLKPDGRFLYTPRLPFFEEVIAKFAAE